MTLKQTLIATQPDGTAATTGNTGAASITSNGGSSVTWQGGKLQFITVASQTNLIRTNLNAAASTEMQETAKFTTPPSNPTAAVVVWAGRSTSPSARLCDLKWTQTGSLTFTDSTTTTTQILATGALSFSTEYVVKIDLVGGTTTNGIVDIRIETVGGVLIGSAFHITNANLTVNNFGAYDLGSTNPAMTYSWRHTQSNDGAGGYIADYVASTPLAAPVVTVTNITNPSTVGGSDGSVTVSWPAVPSAVSYEVSSDAATSFTAGTAGTSPYTFTGQSAGTKNYAVAALP